ERPDVTYRELSEQQGVPLSLVLGLHEAIGFQPPSPDERVRQDDLVMVELARTILEAGASEAAVRRAFHLYADNLRRLATAEAELYQAEVQTRLRQEGMTEADLMQYGSQLGQRTGPLVAEHSWGSMSGIAGTCGPRSPPLSPRPRSSVPVCTSASRGPRPSASST